jgi:hypothetical protein
MNAVRALEHHRDSWGYAQRHSHLGNKMVAVVPTTKRRAVAAAKSSSPSGGGGPLALLWITDIVHLYLPPGVGVG